MPSPSAAQVAPCVGVGFAPKALRENTPAATDKNIPVARVLYRCRWCVLARLAATAASEANANAVSP